MANEPKIITNDLAAELVQLFDLADRVDYFLRYAPNTHGADNMNYLKDAVVATVAHLIGQHQNGGDS